MNLFRTIRSFLNEKKKKKVVLFGDYGRLVIESLKIDVPLYDSKGKEVQKIVDDDRSAVAIRWGDRVLIGDHNYQENFRNLYLVHPERTVAEVWNGDRKRTLVCVRKQVGHIEVGLKNRLVDSDWNSVFSQDFGDVCIYTCLGWSANNIVDVVLTYWKERGEQ